MTREANDKYIPKRNKHDELVFPEFPLFRPNLTPSQVLQMGSFGGTYFRPITSAVTGESYRQVYKEFPKEWFKGHEEAGELKDIRCERQSLWCQVRGSLDMWESSGWISDTDPYGWFQWYCRVLPGRRSTDDERQVKRALGVMSKKGRFRNMLIKKCAMAGTTHNDANISPVVRQSLQHWGYRLTKRDADAYVKLKKLAAASRVVDFKKSYSFEQLFKCIPTMSNNASIASLSQKTKSPNHHCLSHQGCEDDNRRRQRKEKKKKDR